MVSLLHNQFVNLLHLSINDWAPTTICCMVNLLCDPICCITNLSHCPFCCVAEFPAYPTLLCGAIWYALMCGCFNSNAEWFSQHSPQICQKIAFFFIGIDYVVPIKPLRQLYESSTNGFLQSCNILRDWRNHEKIQAWDSNEKSSASTSFKFTL